MSAVIAVVVFLTAYVLIATERVPKTVVALVGAGIVVALGVSTSEDIFYSAETGIDWDVIFLLLGMMIIVGILRRTGVFEFVAIWAAKRAKGSPLRVMILLVLITALASAFLDNVTTVLLIAPVTLLVCDRLDVSPVPFLISEVIASNLGGTSTLIGDPPNIIIASRSGLSFNDFLLNLAPIAALAIAVFIATLPVLFRGSFHVDPARVADVMALNEREAIKDRRLLIICGIVLAAVFTGFIGHAVFHIEPSVVALLGAGTLVLLSRSKPREFMPSVEWETLLFFTGLFIMIGALAKTGVIDRLAGAAVEATGGERTLTGDLKLGGRHYHVKVRDADPTTRVVTDGVYTEFFDPDVFVSRERITGDPGIDPDVPLELRVEFTKMGRHNTLVRIIQGPYEPDVAGWHGEGWEKELVRLADYLASNPAQETTR